MRNKNLPSLFSDFAYNFNPSSLPISSINIFKICLADWVSVSIAAQNCEVAKKILSLAEICKSLLSVKLLYEWKTT